ncbi:MAG: hypothetical protein PW788_09995 [Micavibrio sp.]|nr:hypothetical protein [Micavibrio sp.]
MAGTKNKSRKVQGKPASRQSPLSAVPFAMPSRPYLLLALAILLAYIDIYPNTFIMDDIGLIVRNRFLTSWSYLPDLVTHLNYAGSRGNEGYYRPVPGVLHLIVYQLFGASTVAFHTLNIICHAINAGLVYRLGRKLGFAEGATFVAALLWCLHPLHTEAVSYMNSTPELLWVTFTLLGLLALVPECSWWNAAKAAACFLLALGCKEASVVFSALAVLCMFMTSQDRFRLSTYIRTLPFWLMTVAYICIYTALNPFKQCEGNLSAEYLHYCGHIFVRILTSLATLPVYAGLIFYPTGLHMERVFPFQTDALSPLVLAGAALAAGAALVVLLGRGRRWLPLGFGLTWFVIALSPATGVLVPADQLILEHWMYMPTVGLFFGLSQAAANGLARLNSLPDKMKTEGAALLALVAAALLGFKTYSQNQIWLNPPSFYANVFAHGGYRRGLADLGYYYLRKHAFDDAAQSYEAALKDFDPNAVPEPALHRALALAYLHVGLNANYTVTSDDINAAMPNVQNVPQAIEQLQKAVALDPDEYFSYGLLSALYKKQGDTKKSQLYYKKMQEAYQRKTVSAP